MKEIRAKEYAKQNGLSLFTINKYCRIGTLTCRKFNKGVEVEDYKTTRGGYWLVDTTKPIGA